MTFAGLIPGTYQVSVNTPTGDVVTQPIANPITLTAANPNQTVIEGLFNPGALSGHIFLDQNGDGIQQSGDTNLAGVTVTLLNSAGASTGTTAVTDANGFYQFSNLIAGTYSVAFTAPTGDKFSATTAGTSPVDSIVNTTTGKTSPVAVVAGATTTNQNAAVFLPATITAHVYADANDNGSQDNGEGNLAGVTVNLLTSAGVATGVTAITDANGNVSFTGLVPGSYEVSVNTPAGDIVTQHNNVGTLIPVTSGQTAAPAIEGLFVPGALSGHIFTDQNADGIQESGDTNLAGVTVTLLNSAGASTGTTAVTDANGFYQFSNLIAGTYSVAFTAPTGDKFSATTAGTSSVDSIVNTTTGKTSPVAVVTGATTTNQNAAVFLPATITAHVYADANDNGSQDNGEGNLAGVTVNLLTSAGVATGVTAITDANGNVSFTGLVPGSYEVSVNAPTGDTVTQHNNVGTLIPVTSGQTAAPAIEGLFVPGALSGHIFTDQNADGIQESGDTNLAGVTVTLLNSAGASTGTTAVTDANGFYQFSNLIAGTYSVAFTAPTGDKFSATTAGTSSVDSIVNTTTGKTSPVAVVAGATTTNQNAAVFLPATITAHVYADANDNGSQDNGEGNLAGVTVNLLTSAGVATGVTAITDANGNVSFTGLVPGSYEVSVNAPTGDTVTQHNNVGTLIPVTSGQTAAPAIEGLFVPASLSGHVFLDANDNGVQDSGDTNVAGVTVKLFTSAGVNTGLTATTDANGFYQFTNLTAGTYIVDVLAPTGTTIDTTTGTNANAAVDSIVNTAGMVAASVTAGANTPNQNAGIFAPATITAHVYADANDNSSQDNGEGNLAGVTVNLLTSAGVATGVTAITDANGNVSFTGLVPGSYEVSVNTPTGDTVTQHSNVGTLIPVTSGQTAAPAIEGLFVPASLSGHVFLDANDNGVQDSGDTNVAGVTVKLFTSAGVNTGLTATTDANGFYQFTNLTAGTYIVDVLAPTGTTIDTTTGTNANAAVDSIVNTAGMVAASVTAGATHPQSERGHLRPGHDHGARLRGRQ